MKILLDYQGRSVRLTDERRRHILLHREMANMGSSIKKTLY